VLKAKKIQFILNDAGDHNQMGVIERLNQSIRRRLQLVWSAQSSRQWAKIMQEVTDNYNNSVHSSIRVTPAEAWSGETPAGGPKGPDGTPLLGNPNTETEKKEQKARARVKVGAPKLPRGFSISAQNSAGIGSVGRVYTPPPNDFTKRAHHESYSSNVYEIVGLPSDHFFQVKLLAPKTKAERAKGVENVRRDHFHVIASSKVGTDIRNRRLHKRVTDADVSAVVKKRRVGYANAREGIDKKNVVGNPSAADVYRNTRSKKSQS